MADTDFRVYACRDTSAMGGQYWYEVETGDPGKEVVCHTGGMYATEDEALKEGNLWTATEQGLNKIKEAFTRSCYQD